MTAGTAAAASAAAASPRLVRCACCLRQIWDVNFVGHLPCRPPYEPEPMTRVFAALMSVSWDPTRWDQPSNRRRTYDAEGGYREEVRA